MTPKRKKNGKGVVSSFITAHANWDAESSPSEIKRLFELARANGIETPLGNMTGTFYSLRRKRMAQKRSANAKPHAHPVRHDALQTIESFLSQFELVVVAIKEVLEANRTLQEENATLKATLDRVTKLEQEMHRLMHS